MPKDSWLRIATYFGIAGFLGGLASAVFLFWFIDWGQFPVVLGLESARGIWLMPIGGAFIAWFTAIVLIWIFPNLLLGSAFGVLVAIISFLAFDFLYSLVVVGRDFIQVFPGFIFFGGITVAPMLVVTGTVAGHLIKRRMEKSATGGA